MFSGGILSSVLSALILRYLQQQFGTKHEALTPEMLIFFDE